MTAFNFRMHAGGACKPLLPLADNIIEQDADVALWPSCVIGRVAAIRPQLEDKQT